MNPLFHTGFSISDSLKSVLKSVLIYETIIVGISHRSDFPRRNTFFVLSLEIIPYVLLGVYQEPSDMLVINNI